MIAHRTLDNVVPDQTASLVNIRENLTKLSFISLFRSFRNCGAATQRTLESGNHGKKHFS